MTETPGVSPPLPDSPRPAASGPEPAEVAIDFPAPDQAVEVNRNCPECGAHLVWMAGAQTLGCSYCGTLLPAEPASDPQAVPPGFEAHLEHDLAEALRHPPTGRDWGDARREVQCDSCGAVSIFVDGRVAQRCDFCDSPKVLTHEAHGDAITPQSVLPFRVAEAAVRDQFRTWIASLWFAPNALKGDAALDRLHGVYLPYWTFDARVSATWSAESGRMVSRQVRRQSADGKWQMAVEQTVVWTPVSGAFEHFFDDELVPGSEGLHRGLLRRIEPFPTTTSALQVYDADYVRGWTVERYRIDLRQAQGINHQDMEIKVRGLASARVGSPLQRNLQVAAQYSGRTFKHILVPVWLVGYRYHGKAYQIAANGWTGAMAGERPWSWVKIALAVVLALIVVAIGLAFQR